jgi:hypothetical protein
VKLSDLVVPGRRIDVPRERVRSTRKAKQQGRLEQRLVSA